MNRHPRIVWSVALLLAIVLVVPAVADVKLPKVIGSNMVLQRDMAVPVWGWADNGEEVTVTINGQTKKTTAADGKWILKLDAMSAGGPFEMKIQGKNEITLNNVLIGEVWVCSGQSNMQWSTKNSVNGAQEVANAKYPNIRLFTVPLKGTQEEQFDCGGAGWQECSPETVPWFTAVGYFFGRELYKELNIPIGLINNAWGGSSCEAWVPRDVIEANPDYAEMLKRYDDQCVAFDAGKPQAAYEKQLAAWKEAEAKAKAEGKPAPNKPRPPRDIRYGQHRVANCYCGCLRPIIPFGIRGAIWYQGETNAGRAYQYRHLFPLMIDVWREKWSQGDFPFYFVQLANFMGRADQPGESAWAELREAQSMTLSTPNTGQAVTIDIGDAQDIHPKNKQDVGKRLALWALKKDYGKDVVYYGPKYKSMAKDGAKIVLSFDHVGSGLMAKGGQLKGFAIAGADKKFVWADAKIEGDKVVVSSPQVQDPVAVRYAWANNPECNLYNKEDIPASPFRTDAWPGVTINNK